MKIERLLSVSLASAGTSLRDLAADRNKQR